MLMMTMNKMKKKCDSVLVKRRYRDMWPVFTPSNIVYSHSALSAIFVGTLKRNVVSDFKPYLRA